MGHKFKAVKWTCFSYRPMWRMYIALFTDKSELRPSVNEWPGCKGHLSLAWDRPGLHYLDLGTDLRKFPVKWLPGDNDLHFEVVSFRLRAGGIRPGPMCLCWGQSAPLTALWKSKSSWEGLQKISHLLEWISSSDLLKCGYRLREVLRETNPGHETLNSEAWLGWVGKKTQTQGLKSGISFSL